MQTKTCSKCSEEKPLTEFHKQKTGKYGVTGLCKGCKREKDREYRSRPEFQEKNREYQRKYRQRPESRRYVREYLQRPEVKERRLEQVREYRQNPDIRNRLRKRDREDKRELRAMGVLPNQYFEIAKKYATRKGRWSDAEIEFLMSSKLPLVDIALELGRTYPSVQVKRQRLRKLQDAA